MQLVRGDLVRDHFLGSWHRLTDGAPHQPEYDLHAGGLRSDVLVHGFEVNFGHRDFALLAGLRCSVSTTVEMGAPRLDVETWVHHCDNANVFSLFRPLAAPL